MTTMSEMTTLFRGRRDPAGAQELAGITWIVPAYNEEGAIASTIGRLEATLSAMGRPYEIIVVNDGSRDETMAMAMAATGRVRVLNHPINTGYGSAIKTGIAAAQYEFLGIVDADGTYNIEQAPELVAQMDAGFDMVVGARKGVLELDRPLKRVLRQLLIAFLNFVVAGRIVDPNSGFRMFTKTLAATFFPFLCNTFSFTTSLTVFAFGQGFFVSYIPTEFNKRVGKSKVRHIRDGIRMAQLILEGITYFNALKFFIILAVLMLVFVAMPSLIMLACGLPSLASLWAIFGVAGIALVGMGVLGDIVRLANIDRSYDMLLKQRDYQ